MNIFLTYGNDKIDISKSKDNEYLTTNIGDLIQVDIKISKN